MADQYDPMKDPAKHAAPEKTLVDKVIELALGVGGGAVTLLSGLLAAVLIIYSGYVLYDSFSTEQRAASNAWDLLQFKPEIFEDYETPLTSSELVDINKDYRAWLTVYDTDIDYPVMQGPNDLYYATHDIYNRVSVTGAIYLAAGNRGDFSDSYNLIYGHHMDNGAMFGALDRMNGTETGVIVTEQEIYDVEFFAVLVTDAYESRIYAVGNRMNDVLAFLRSGGEGGVGLGTTVTYFNEAVAADAEKLVALSTCADTQTSGRLVVIGKMTKHIVMKDITVSKVWDDAEDQDGLRPEAITVVASDGTEVTLTAEEGWTATVSVRKFDNLGEITYRWDERPVPGYTLTGNVTEGDSTTLTNRHEPAVTSAEVKKVWTDDENRDGLRPASVTAILSNGQSVELNAQNGWTAAIGNLPVYDHGEKIEYTWTENEVDGYTLTVDQQANPTTLTNTHIPETTDLSVSKVWDDQNNQDGIRPSSVRVSLYGNDTLIGEVTLSESNSWTGTISGLYVNEARQPISYRWEEAPVNGYTLSTSVKGNATTLTNTHIPETIDLSVSKVWDDNENQDRVRPRSLRVGLSNGRWVTLSEGNGWTDTITGLPKYAAGEEIVYTWTEADVRGYEQTGSVTAGTSTVITNRHETDTTVATVVKSWDDDGDRDGLRPESVTVTLSNGEERTLSAENNWTATVTGLPANADGQPISYTWTEQPVEGYTAEITSDGTTTTIVNRHSAAKTSSTVRKVWEDADDQDGIRPDTLVVTLNANGNPVTSVTLPTEDGWTATVNDLPANEAGEPITYTWTEQAVPGYTLSESADGDAYVLTNTHIPETLSLTLRKVWEDGNDQDDIRPDALNVTLNANGEPAASVTLTAEGEWTATVNDLPVYQNGEAIRYSWTEEAADGYTLTAQSEEGHVTTLTNTHVPDTKTLTVHKVWEDDGDRDRIRPSILQVSLLADGETLRTVPLNSANGWSASFENLPVNKNGSPIAYTFAEEPVEGYTLTDQSASDNLITLTNTHEVAAVDLTVRKVWVDDEDRDGGRPDTLTVELKGNNELYTTVELSAENDWTATVTVPEKDRGSAIDYSWSEPAVSGYTRDTRIEGRTTVFTNTHAPAVETLTVVKVWDDGEDQDGLRPESLAVDLLADNETVETVTLTAEGNWTATVENLPANKNGKEIKYTWREEDVAGYIQSKAVPKGPTTTFTNTHTPETADFTVKKVWDDANDQDGIRPEELTVRLIANGEEAAAVILNEANGWFAAVKDLPLYMDGQPIEYAWDEGTVEGYTLTSVTNGTSTILTNIHETEKTVATVTKVWDDEDNRDGKRPASLLLTLSTGDTVTLSEENGWTGTVENLEKFADGEEIVYTWTEEAVEGYELSGTETNGTVTTITNRHEIITAPLTVIKVWDDHDDFEGLRPDHLDVTLNDTVTVTLNEENGWTETVEGMPVYANGGRTLIYRWTEEDVPGYSLVRTTDGSTTTMTNTHEPRRHLTVVKVWDDQNDAANLRPNSLRVTLRAGTAVIQTVTLNAANSWRTTVDVPAFGEDGELINYTWTEEEVLGYTRSGPVVTGDITTFTNTYRPRPVIPPNPPPVNPPARTPVPPAPTPVPENPTEEIEDYDTPLGVTVEYNHVGDTFD